MEWRIKINERPAQLITDIWIFRRGAKGGEIILWTPKEGDVVEEKSFGYGDSIPPTLTLNTNLLPLLMEALRDNGVKLPDESFTKGKLEATENHLRDLRQLLKLKEKPPITS